MTTPVQSNVANANRHHSHTSCCSNDTQVFFLMTTARIPRVRIYHNNLWARYKGAIFSKIYSSSGRSGVATSFVHIAETETDRAMLGSADISYHQYPYQLLF